jgi:hypothetical protein
MKLTAKILKFKGKKPETVEEVRAAIIAILEDIECGEQSLRQMRKLRAQIKSAKPKDKAALKSFLGSGDRHGVHARTWTARTAQTDQTKHLQSGARS